MGIWDLVNAILRWSPPAVMTLMNEASGSMSGGLLYCSGMIFLGLVLLLTVDVKKGEADVAPDLKFRQLTTTTTAVAVA